ncbi:hypothetical protein AaE_003385, partial [Aphanomyces astaci]
NNTDPTLPDVLSIKTRTDHSFSSSSEHSIESNNQDDTPPGPFTVTVKRFFPIEDKFEFSVTVFDDELLNAGRHFDIIRDRLQVAKYNDALESHAAAVGVGCPSLPRVQAVAALCVTLDDFDLAACSPEHLISLVTKLSFFQTIRVSDLDGQPLAYALAATWKLVHHVYAVARLEVVAPDDDDLSPAPESVPWHLWVHSATCFESATGRTLLLPTSTEVQDHLQTVFNYAVALIHLPHAKARFLVARTLQQ